jgi:hypothetical protein
MAPLDPEPATRRTSRVTASRPIPSRAPVVGRGAALGQAPLLACTAGPHRVVFDLRTLRHIEVDLDVEELPLLPGPAAVPILEVDLREVLATDVGPGQVLLYTCGADPTLRRMIIDKGSLSLLRVDVTRVLPLPPFLAHLRGFSPVRGVVELDGGALAWLVDPERLRSSGASA